MSFSFVYYDGPKLPQDSGVRKLIRRQAMREVAIGRRIRGGYGQSNLRQYPVFLESDNTKDDSPLHGNKRPASSHPLPVSIAYPDCATTEKLALLLNLIPLTGLRLGIAKFSSLKYDLVRSDHAGGAAQLIQFRGAHAFTTESGMALFMAHIGTAVMEAILSNKSCFLAEEGWMKLMRSVIRSDSSLIQLQDLALTIWSHIVTGPAKLKKVTDTISLPTPPPRVIIDAIIQCLLEDRESLLNWMERAKLLPGLRDGDFEVDEYGIMFPRFTFDKGNSNPDRVTQLALWGTNIMCRILKTRLLVAMAPARFHSLEVECQYLATKIMNLDQIATKDNGKGLLQTSFISQSTWIVKGVVETKEIWSEEQDNGEKMIDRWKFEAWCKAIGRKFPYSK